MPRLSVWFVRCSLVYLLLGFTLGGLMLANKGLPFAAWAWSLLGAHMEFLLLGWMVQLAMGVAFWILPRFGSGAPRGNELLIWTAFATLNLGIWMAALQLYHMQSWLTFTGRILEAFGVFLFVFGSWQRVKPLEA
ncbi:MAG TPA: hypothetical protein VKE92_04495 [Anaerolineales bacterium]|nr:hypothetical protein [Anaerolineales bacterium]